MRNRVELKRAEIKLVKGTRVKLRGVKNVENTMMDSNLPKLSCMSDLKKMMQDEMKRLGVTPTQMRKSLGVKKYEED